MIFFSAIKPVAIVSALVILSACTQPVSEQSINRNAFIVSLNLTPDEQNIWKGLTPAQQDRAVTFIQNGGTLIGSLGSN